MTLDDHALDALFRQARTHNALHRRAGRPTKRCTRLYDLMKWGPTSANSCPARFVFVQEPRGQGAAAARAVAGQRRQDDGGAGDGDRRLRPRVLRKAAAAVPAHRRAQLVRRQAAEHIRSNAFRGGTLQGAYLIIAARALGLDCGPMGGFDNAKVDAAFFPDGKVKSNFLCNLGYGDPAKLHPRNPRLDFDEACRIE